MKALNAFVAGLIIVDAFFVGHYFGLHSHHVLVAQGSDTHPELWIPMVAKTAPPQMPVQVPSQTPKPTVLASSTTTAAPSAPALFADDSEVDVRLRNGISTAASLGILKPSAKEKFNPNAPVTRGEFAGWLAAARELNLVQPKDATFGDVGADNPYYTAVEAVNKAGLMTGVKDKDSGTEEFQPNKSISREDFAVLYSEFANKQKRGEGLTKEQVEQYLFANPATGQQTRFTYKDVGDIDDSAYKWVAVAHQAGVLDQAFAVDPVSNDTEKRYLRPHQKMTRAEAINVLMKLYGTPEQSK